MLETNLQIDEDKKRRGLSVGVGCCECSLCWGFVVQTAETLSRQMHNYWTVMFLTGFLLTAAWIKMCF